VLARLIEVAFFLMVGHIVSYPRLNAAGCERFKPKGPRPSVRVA
jgi:hypothetical protein